MTHIGVQASTAGPLAKALATGRIPGMDFLRAAAVIVIMMGHAGLYVVGIGLQVLLVLSGFLITWMLLEEQARKGSVDVRRFHWRRFTRLTPALYAYILLGTLYALLRGQEVSWLNVVAAATHWINYLQAYNDGPTHYLAHIWSLALQEQFYLIWPTVLLVCWRRGIPLQKAIIGMVLLVWAYRVLACLVLDASDAYLYRAFETRSDNLAIGGLLAVCLRDPGKVAWFDRWHRYGLWIVLLIVAYLQWSVQSLRLLSLTHKYGLSFAIDPVLIALAIPFVIQAAAGQGWLASMMRSRFVGDAGQGSYAMYLLHGLLMYPIMRVLEGRGVPTTVAFLASIPIVVLTGIASFKYFENPAREWLDRRFGPGPRVAPH
jgi:peptidoglycan/LPS O-acetylase OafA/YrhL